MHSIHIENCTAKFGDAFYLENINWTLEPNQHWLITGCNGSGKSALAALLAGAGKLSDGAVSGLPAHVELVSFEVQRELIARELKKDDADILDVIAVGRDLAARLPVPRACRDLALLVAEYHTHVHRALELRPKTILNVLEKTDAFRRPDRFERFLVTCEADARGRAGLENRRYEQAGVFRGAFAAASAVDAGAIAKEVDDKKIPVEIRRARKRAISEFRAAR